jgi:hypothetical protein
LEKLLRHLEMVKALKANGLGRVGTWHNGYDGAQSQEKIQNQKEEKKKVF